MGVDKDRIKCSAKQAEGSVKEHVGKMTGDAKLRSEGKADKAEGKIQNVVAGAKEKVKESLD